MLRNAHSYMQFSAHTNYFQHYFFPHVMAIWNSLPSDILHHLLLFSRHSLQCFYGRMYHISVLSLFMCFALCIKFHRKKKHTPLLQRLFLQNVLVKHADTYTHITGDYLTDDSSLTVLLPLHSSKEVQTLLCFGLNATYLVNKRELPNRYSVQLWDPIVSKTVACMQSLL